jgi:nucleotide-binding universal stress UspA family protein
MYRTIVVGTDCSPTATAAVMKAADLAKLTGAVRARSWAVWVKVERSLLRHVLADDTLVLTEALGIRC